MLTLSPRDIANYVHCPMLCRLEQAAEVPLSPHRVPRACRLEGEERFNWALACVIKQFLFQAVSYGTIDLRTLKTRFAKIYGIPYKKPTRSFKPIKMGRDDVDRVIYKANVALTDFYEYYLHEVKGHPLAVDASYILEFEDAYVHGKIDLIWENMEDKIIVAKIGASLTENETVKDTEAILQAMGYRHLSAHSEDRIGLFKVLESKMYTARLKENEITAWSRYVNYICKAIKQGLFYPRLGGHCMSCSYRKECMV